MFKFWSRHNDNERRDGDQQVIHRQIISSRGLDRQISGCDEELQREIFRAIENQPPGRYRVRVRRKNVHI